MKTQILLEFKKALTKINKDIIAQCTPPRSGLTFSIFAAFIKG